MPDAGHGTSRSGRSGGGETTINGGDGVCGVHSSIETVPSQTDMVGRPLQRRPTFSEQPMRNISPGVHETSPPSSVDSLHALITSNHARRIRPSYDERTRGRCAKAA